MGFVAVQSAGGTDVFQLSLLRSSRTAMQRRVAVPAKHDEDACIEPYNVVACMPVYIVRARLICPASPKIFILRLAHHLAQAKIRPKPLRFFTPIALKVSFSGVHSP